MCTNLPSDHTTNSNSGLANLPTDGEITPGAATALEPEKTVEMPAIEAVVPAAPLAAQEAASVTTPALSETAAPPEEAAPQVTAEMPALEVPESKEESAEQPADAKEAAPETEQPADAKEAAPETEQPAGAKEAAPETEQPADAKEAAPKTEQPADAKEAAPKTEQSADAKEAAPETEQPADAKEDAPEAKQAVVTKKAARPTHHKGEKSHKTSARKNGNRHDLMLGLLYVIFLGLLFGLSCAWLMGWKAKTDVMPIVSFEQLKWSQKNNLLAFMHKESRVTGVEGKGQESRYALWTVDRFAENPQCLLQEVPAKYTIAAWLNKDQDVILINQLNDSTFSEIAEPQTLASNQTKTEVSGAEEAEKPTTEDEPDQADTTTPAHKATEADSSLLTISEVSEQDILLPQANNDNSKVVDPAETAQQENHLNSEENSPSTNESQDVPAPSGEAAQEKQAETAKLSIICCNRETEKATYYNCLGSHIHFVGASGSQLYFETATYNQAGKVCGVRLYAWAPGQETPQAITDIPSQNNENIHIKNISVSPDESRIAIVILASRNPVGAENTETDREHTALGLWIYNCQNKKLAWTTVSSENAYDLNVCWNKESTWLSGAATYDGEAELFLYDTEQAMDAAKISGSDFARQLMPSLASNKKKVIYLTATERVLQYNFDDHALSTLLNAEKLNSLTPISQMTLSPNQDTAAYCGHVYNTQSLWISSIHSPAPTQVRLASDSKKSTLLYRLAEHIEYAVKYWLRG